MRPYLAQVRIGGRLVFLDAVLLDNSHSKSKLTSDDESSSSEDGAPAMPTVCDRMCGNNVVGILFLVGPQCRSAREKIRATVMRRGKFRDQVV